jgi:Tfp pilus assembly protein PilW
MMVGLSAGLLVTMAGISTLLLARQGFATTSDQSLNFDAGRLGIDLVARNVRMAGSPPFDPATVTTDINFALPNGDLALGGTEGGDATDTLTVRYWSNQAYDAARWWAQTAWDKQWAWDWWSTSSASRPTGSWAAWATAPVRAPPPRRWPAT